jgi:hypothetical protein
MFPVPYVELIFGWISCLKGLLDFPKVTIFNQGKNNLQNYITYCHALSDRRRGIGLSTGFIGLPCTITVTASQCTPFTTPQ